MPNEIITLSPYPRRPLPTARDFAAVLFRQRRVIIWSFLSIIGLVFVLGIWTRKYEAHMKIIVLRHRMDAVVSSQPDAPSQDSPEITEEDLNSEVELLRSEDLLRSVVLSTGLDRRSATILHHRDDKEAVAVAVRALAKELDVETIRKTNVIEVRYKASDPQMAAQVLTAIEAAYIKKHREVHRPSGEFTFFDQQTEKYRRQLAVSQGKLADFTRNSGVVSADMQRDLTLQRLSDFDASANQTDAEVAETSQRIRSLQKQLRAAQPRLTTQIRTTENPQLMEELKSTLLNLELKRTELLTKFDPSYRLVQEVDTQIAEARASIAAEENRPPRDETTDQDPTYLLLRSELAKAYEDLQGLNAKAAATRAVANDYREAARSLEEKSLEQEDLLRNKKTQEDNYLLYLKKREEARISDALDQRGILNVAIAEPPMVPALPVRSPEKTAGLTLLLGFFFSMGAAFLRDYVDPSFRTPAEVAGYLEMPVLASLPHSETRR